MAHRGHRVHTSVSSDPTRYRGISIAVTPVRTVHCKAVNQQIDPAVARSQYHDPQSAACFACGGDKSVAHRCKS